MKKNVIIIFVLVLFMSCEKNSNPLEPDHFNNEIIGKWKSARTILIFYNDYTFIDSVYGYISITDSISKLRYVLSGNYTIEGKILEYENFHFTYLDSSITGVSVVPFFKEISFSNDSLVLTSVNILDRIEGQDNEIWGIWTVTRFTYHCKNNPLTTLYNGREKYTYKFLKDTTIAEYKWEYIDDKSRQPYESYSDYFYDPPYLDLIGPGYYNLKVEFKNSKMYWYVSSSSFERVQ